MSIIVLDTDVASTILRERLADPLRSRLAGHSLCITFVTLGELTQWRVIRDWGPRRMANFEAWRHRVGLLPYDDAVAIKWGEIQGNAHLEAARDQSTTVGLPPAAWPTTYRWQPLTQKISLITLNTTGSTLSTVPPNKLSLIGFIVRHPSIANSVARNHGSLGAVPRRKKHNPSVEGLSPSCDWRP